MFSDFPRVMTSDGSIRGTLILTETSPCGMSFADGVDLGPGGVVYRIVDTHVPTTLQMEGM